MNNRSTGIPHLGEGALQFTKCFHHIHNLILPALPWPQGRAGYCDSPLYKLGAQTMIGGSGGVRVKVPCSGSKLLCSTDDSRSRIRIHTRTNTLTAWCSPSMAFHLKADLGSKPPYPLGRFTTQLKENRSDHKFFLDQISRKENMIHKQKLNNKREGFVLQMVWKLHSSV